MLESEPCGGIGGECIGSEAEEHVLLQDGRRYFENKSTLEYVEANYKPIKEVRVYGAAAVKIYKIHSDDESVEARQRAGVSTNINLDIQ